MTGSNFVPGIKLNFGAGTGVTSITYVDSSHLTVGLSLAGAAVPGTRSVIATNLDAGTSTCVACFTVNPRPTVTSASPGSAARGATNVTVTITGSDFVSGAAAVIGGGGLAMSNVTVVDSNTITMKVNVAASAAVGTRTITVTNPDGGKGASACFSVT